ncbi:MAG: ArgE/DapE family deacylase [Candidatus Omnitrophota bacterium]
MINKDRLVRETQKLLSMNSENPPGNESALAYYIENEMRTLGLDVKSFTYDRSRPNIVACLKGIQPPEKSASRSILISPHIDTVPIGNGWTKDPLGKDIVNGKIYGRGASDDKGNAAVCIEVLRSLIEDKVRLNYDIFFAATVDEETGSRNGIIPMLEQKVLKPGFALILDSDECHPVIAQKGLIHCRVRIFGKKAHGAYNWRGSNAIEMAARIIARLTKHKFSCSKHPFLRPPTVNIGNIKGGDKVNIVADFCEFSVDLRFLPGMKYQDVLSVLRGIIRQETSKFVIQIDDIQRPYEIPATHPFVNSYYETAKKMGIKVDFKGSEGATVMTFFKKHKIPAFATGFGTSGNAHTTDEYAKISILWKGARLMERFLIDFDKKR